MPRTRPPYPDEFRREAIELARISSKSQRQIAEDLGISDVTLRNWIKQAERDEGACISEKVSPTARRSPGRKKQLPS